MGGQRTRRPKRYKATNRSFALSFRQSASSGMYPQNMTVVDSLEMWHWSQNNQQRYSHQNQIGGDVRLPISISCLHQSCEMYSYRFCYNECRDLPGVSVEYEPAIRYAYCFLQTISMFEQAPAKNICLPHIVEELEAPANIT